MNKHLIFTNGRSGSNYLVNLLNAHPQVVNYGEVLGFWTLPYQIYKKIAFGKEPGVAYLKYIYNSKIFLGGAQIYSAWSHLQRKENINFKFPNQIKTIGVKDFSINFVKQKIENFVWEYEDLRVINLYRENSLQRFVSYIMLKKTNIIKVDSHKTSNQKREKIYIDTQEFMEGLEIVDRETEEQLAIAGKIPCDRVFSISYENLFSAENNQKCQESILEFLGVEALNLTSNHKKILPVNLADIIENYEEILPKIQASKYEKYLTKVSS
jgi:LPS sulfotransferase NodH